MKKCVNQKWLVDDPNSILKGTYVIIVDKVQK